MIHNTYLPEQLIYMPSIKPNRRLNDKLVKELIEFAPIDTSNLIIIVNSTLIKINELSLGLYEYELRSKYI